jgi:hypothetical protein
MFSSSLLMMSAKDNVVYIAVLLTFDALSGANKRFKP